MNEREIRLDQTKKVFDTLADLICKEETCTYRYLIYDLLGFEHGNYAELINGMAVTNLLVENEEMKERIKVYEHQQFITDFITENGIICQKNKEIERLNNIINELEKYVIEEIESYDKALNNTTFVLTEKGKESYEAEKMCFTDMLDKIKKLKESE